MRRPVLVAATASFLGCTTAIPAARYVPTFAGRIEANRYVSPKGTIDCQVPRPSPSLLVTDASDDAAETVTFHVEYSWIHRIDVLRRGVHPLTKEERSLEPAAELAALRDRFFAKTLRPGFQRAAVLDARETEVAGSPALLVVARLTVAGDTPVEHVRGFLFERDGDAVVILHYHHPLEEDPATIETALLELRGLCRFR